jgi:hypothetical protein
VAAKNLQELMDEVVPKIGSERFLAEAKKVDNWITELTELVVAANAWGAENSYPTVDAYPQYLRARGIGEEIFRWGGRKKILQTAYKSVRKRLDQRGLSHYDSYLLEYGWNGIGGWQP